MNSQDYIEKISNLLSRSFDIERAHHYKGKTFDLFAASFVRSERYVASKKIQVYGFENNEYCLVKRVKDLYPSVLADFTSILIDACQDLVKPHEEHMSTIITGVVVVEGKIDESLKHEIKRFNYNKSFLLGLKGWTYIRLLVVDIDGRMVFSNRRGKEILRFYEVFK